MFGSKHITKPKDQIDFENDRVLFNLEFDVKLAAWGFREKLKKEELFGGKM